MDRKVKQGYKTDLDQGL